MAHHEIKQCCRCGNDFECKAGSITECQCSQIQLSNEERIYIEHKFPDCLCIDCLRFLQKEYMLVKKIHFKI